MARGGRGEVARNHLPFSGIVRRGGQEDGRRDSDEGAPEGRLVLGAPTHCVGAAFGGFRLRARRAQLCRIGGGGSGIAHGRTDRGTGDG
eukprot:scaffold1112_cov116-Isochrysis_galbana.AAC.18